MKTNGKRKIRQIETQTKEHTHTTAKPKETKENKVQESDPVSKWNQKIIPTN